MCSSAHSSARPTRAGAKSCTRTSSTKHRGWYADGFVHDVPKVSNLVNLYALVSRMRVRSSPSGVENADKVVLAIIETYLEPNRGFRDLKDILDNDAMNPLRDFSNACREELRGLDDRP